MKFLLFLVFILVFCTAVFENIYLSSIIVILIVLYIILSIIYWYNYKQVDVLISILCNLNISDKPIEQKESLRLELLDGMNIIQKYIYDKKFKKRK